MSAPPDAAPRHGSEAPSAWVRRWSHLVPAGGGVLDVACGHGRHARWFHERGHTVTAIDRDGSALATLQGVARTVEADIEGGAWPLRDETFSGVVVTNYLWRPLLPTLIGCVAEGGILIYETFATGNETVGKPARPDFLLQPGELLRACAELRVIAYEDGFLDAPDRYVQRIAAAREPTGKIGPFRWRLA